MDQARKTTEQKKHPGFYKIKMNPPRKYSVSYSLFLVAAFLLLSNVPLVAQKPDAPGATQQQQSPPQGMGVSTGTAVVSTTKRTVGIVDPKAPVLFEDVTLKTALANFKH